MKNEIKPGDTVRWLGDHSHLCMSGLVLATYENSTADIQWTGQSLEKAHRESSGLPIDMMIHAL